MAKTHSNNIAFQSKVDCLQMCVFIYTRMTSCDPGLDPMTNDQWPWHINLT